jgi:hypothetical protein
MTGEVNNEAAIAIIKSQFHVRLDPFLDMLSQAYPFGFVSEA